MTTKKTPVAKVVKKTAKTKAHPAPDTRRALGRVRANGAARFPVAPPKSELPGGYGETLRELTGFIQEARLRAVLTANAAMIQLYWGIGRSRIVRPIPQ
jgi:hypothetical protein